MSWTEAVAEAKKMELWKRAQAGLAKAGRLRPVARGKLGRAVKRKPAE